MGYAIMQKELVVPSLEQLKRAFTVLPTLTELDAQTVANDAYGIFMRGLDSGPAAMLQEALRAEGVATEVIDESKLPVIPTAKIVRRVEIHPDHLTVHDPMKRVSEVPWREVMFIATGLVRVREWHTVRELETLGGTRAKEESTQHLLLDVFLNGGAVRYSITGDDFSFEHLGARLSEDRAMNFVLLVQDLAQNAPHAGLNRGAFMACQNPPELFSYPTRQTFNEEMTWMLWRIANLAPAR